MSKNSGFAVTEVIMAIAFLFAVGGVFYLQRLGSDAAHRDTQRKTAINAIYYNLTEVVKPKLGGFPRTLSTEQLTAMDGSLLTDPHGKRINDADSDYRYDPGDCNGGDICQSFTLRAKLEREDTFVKRSYQLQN